jgi:hypothetical protein
VMAEGWQRNPRRLFRAAVGAASFHSRKLRKF